MAVNSMGNSSLEAISTSYQARDTKEEDDYLGMENFLTMLVAQLQNQDPLNPMEGTEFSTQLAQFSQLEQLINLNENVENMGALGSGSAAGDINDYLGMEVTGRVDTLEVEGGMPSPGFYNLDQSARVKITIYDQEGMEVRTLYPGQQEAGSYGINWDGRDSGGNGVQDGSYSYVVMADSGSGYAAVPTTVTGTVDSVVYSNDKPYLEVNGVLMDPGALIQVRHDQGGNEAATSALDYLGMDAATADPMVLVENSAVKSGGPVFTLNSPEPVTVTIRNSTGSVVKTINLTADEVSSGSNTLAWDGTDLNGNVVEDGVYSYEIETSSGTAVKGVSGEIAGVRNVGGVQYLTFRDSGLLTRMADLTSVN